MYAIGMSGPPRCGKNTIALALADRLDHLTDRPIHVMSLSEPMGKCAAGLLGVTYSEEWYEREKDQIQNVLGVTLRRFIIDLSEKFMKLEYGNDIWMHLFRESIPLDLIKADGIVIIVNFGFEHEPTFVETHVAAPDKLLTIQVMRDNKDFAGDSRSYVRSTHNFGVYHRENGTAAAVDGIIARLRVLYWPIASDLNLSAA